MLRPPRDHDIVVDHLMRIYVVVGNLHPPNGLIAYLKYVRSDTKTLWGRGGTYYERVLKTYGVKSLHKYLTTHQELVLDPILNAYVPVVNLMHVRSYYYPELRFKEILSRAEDELELTVLEFADLLRTNCGHVSDSLGVTGSLLTKTHNVNTSDVDVVMYGCNSSAGFLESIDRFESLRPTQEVLMRYSKTYGIPAEVLGKIYPPFRGLMVRGKVVNVIFVDDSTQPRYGSEIYVNLLPVELVVEVPGRECTSLYYPSEARVDKVVEVLYPKKDALLSDGVESVVSYEGLFSYALYVGGRLRVRGLLQRIIPTNKYRVLVGGVEEPGYVIPA